VNHDWVRLSAGETWQGRRLTDKPTLNAFLSADRVYAAYALGDLEPTFFEQCVWYGAQTMGELRSLVLIFHGLKPPALFLMGDGAGLALLLGSLVREPNVYATFRSEHRATLEAYYVLGRVDSMERMVLRPEAFRPDRRHMPVRLTPSSVGELQNLYELGEGGVAFSAYQLAQGCFYGIRHQGRLVTVAGTHVVAPQSGVAAVGNVFTHPDYRGRGYGAACTSRVSEDLLSRQLLVVLNVNEANTSAINVYRRLGYERYCSFLETPALRRTSR